MKKFRHFKQVEQKEKKSKAGLYLAIFLAVIMIGGIGGIFLGNPSTTSDNSFGKYDFKNVNNYWVTTVNKKETSFYFLPQQVADLSVSQTAFERIKNSQGLIIVFYPGHNSTKKLQALDVFRFEVANALVTAYNKQVGFGITTNSSAYTLPILNCINSSFYLPIMLVDFENETAVSLINDCIIVSATDENSLLSLMDNLKYRIYGVLE